MLAIPLRSHSEPHLQRSMTAPSLYQAPGPIPAPSATATAAMISIMPTSRPLTPKRPKLSLQTSSAAALPASTKSRTALNSLSTALETPTTFRNTCENAFEPTPSTPVSAHPHPDQAFAQLGQSERPSPHTASSSSSISTLSSGPTSPFANTAPYTLALGARSILRNSPLPRRHLANMSNRPPKRLFQPVKRVSFHENLIDMIPSTVISESEVSDMDVGNVGQQSKDATTTYDSRPLDKRDGVPGRRKRRGRDWIWRPVDEESLPISLGVHASSPVDHAPSAVAHPSSPDIAPNDSRLPLPHLAETEFRPDTKQDEKLER